MYSASRDQVPVQLLKRAIKAGRAALRRLDEDNVPPKLRKVAAYQGGRLPAPLARGLIAALDEDEGLREKSLEELSEASSDDDPSRLFLLRPDGWKFELGRMVERSAQDQAANRIAELDAQIASLKGREAEAKNRLRDAKRKLRELKKQKQAEVEGVRSQLREVREADRQEEARHAQAVADLEEARRLAETAQLRQAKAAESLKQKLQKAEDLRAETEKRLQSGATASWGSGDAIALARHLDNLVRTVEADPALLEFTLPTAGREWKLPPGARPDDRNAIDWLLRQPRPCTLLVDGYNVTFQLSGGPDRAARDRLNEELSRLKLLAMTPVNVLVVYDSGLNPEVETGAGPGGVWLRFTKDSLTADDELRRLAAESDDPVVVVSSDREVREGSEQHGAIGLWAEALVGWIQGR